MKNVAEEIVVNVNYDNITKEISANKSAGAIARTFTANPPAPSFVSKLFFLPDLNTQTGITNYLKERGFRPAKYFEMFALLAEFPELRKIPMVAFGSGEYFNFGGDYYRPFSSMSEKGEWFFGQGCFGHPEYGDCCLEEKNKTFHFLAVKL